jgi:glutamate-ammonia-ligase adenylyltransferase
MGFKRAVRFDESLAVHSGNVRRIFTRIFGEESDGATPIGHETPVRATPGVRAPGTDSVPPVLRQLLDSVAKSEPVSEISESGLETLRMLADRAPHFAEMLAAHPSLAASLERQETGGARDYAAELGSAADSETAFRGKLAALRRTWSRMILEIAVLDIGRRIDVRTAKAMQTALAEASIDVALRVAAEESRARFGGDADGTGYAVLGLGKLGGRGVDYGSDLDVVIVHDDDVGPDSSERHSRMVEIFTEVLGGVTREGHLYRIDLRLRPNGKSGPAAVGRSKIEEYFRTHAAVWEWLAYVKVRHAGGDRALGEWVEGNLRATIYRRAAELGPSELAAQTRSVRDRLEKERSSLSTAKEIDIKFGAGGLLDVYFATRFLQLRGGIPEEGEDRSTKAALDSLLRLGLLGTEDHEALAFGYALLSDIDHTVRLAVGRSTRVSLANHEAMRAICRQTGFEDPEALKDALDSARRRVRAAFLNVVS